MRRMKFVGLRYVAFGIVAIGVMGTVTTVLWNALMPSIFGLPAIGFWQALGLLLLGRILFGGFRGCGRGMKRPRFVRRLEDLTEEERERFRRGMGRGCGNRGSGNMDSVEPPATA
jgi:hypothetical protein